MVKCCVGVDIPSFVGICVCIIINTTAHKIHMYLILEKSWDISIVLLKIILKEEF